MNRPKSMGLAEVLTPISKRVGLLNPLSFRGLSGRDSGNEAGKIQIPRYVCISNGYEVFCLDLNDRKDQSFSRGIDAPPLAKIGTIDLLEEGLPASVGLVKLGADAYMIGGQNFSDFIGQLEPEPEPESESESDPEPKPDPDPKPEDYPYHNPYLEPYPYPYRYPYPYPEPARGICRYLTLCAKYEMKSSSSDIYALSLVKDTLRRCGSNLVLPPLKAPKLWPIIEEINGETHVIDSVPTDLVNNCYDWAYFSHEVLDHDGHSWAEVSTLEIVGYITSHLVVGRKIYAVTHQYSLVFDSETRIWEGPPRSIVKWLSPFSVREVSHILKIGYARCVNVGGGGGFAYGDPRNKLNYIIAIVEDESLPDDEEPDGMFRTHAVAYLITAMGRVVCFQGVRHFFNGPMKPSLMRSATMIKVDDEGKTLCSILSTDAAESEPPYIVFDCKIFVFINTLTVEWLEEGESNKVGELWAKGEEAWPVEQDFVRVHIKDSYIYMQLKMMIFTECLVSKLASSSCSCVLFTSLNIG